LERAQWLFKESAEQNLEGAALNNIGAIYIKLRKPQEAVNYLKKSLRLFEAVKDQENEAKTLHSLGAAYDDMHQWQSGIDHYSQALKLWKKAGQWAAAANTLYWLADSSSQLEKWEQAIQAYKEALLLWSQQNEQPWEGKTTKFAQAKTAFRIAELLAWHQDKPEEAITYYKQALATLSVDEKEWIATIETQLSEVLIKLRRHTEALQYSIKAQYIFNQLNDKWSEVKRGRLNGIIYLEPKYGTKSLKR
jgi:tetratricopeptide (TPR) repeat protein